MKNEKKLSQDELGIFITASIFTEMDSMGMEAERLLPLELDIIHKGEQGITVACSIRNQPIQEWYFYTTQKPEKVIKECILLVNEIDSERSKWIEDFEDDSAPELNQYEHPGNY